MNGFMSLVNTFEHIDSDSSIDNPAGKTLFQDLEEREQSHMSKDESEKSTFLVCSLRMVMADPVFTADTGFYGNAGYTAEQHEYFVITKQKGSDQPAMPCSKAMRKTAFPRIFKTDFVK